MHMSGAFGRAMIIRVPQPPPHTLIHIHTGGVEHIQMYLLSPTPEGFVVNDWCIILSCDKAESIIVLKNLLK